LPEGAFLPPGSSRAFIWLQNEAPLRKLSNVKFLRKTNGRKLGLNQAIQNRGGFDKIFYIVKENPRQRALEGL